MGQSVNRIFAIIFACLMVTSLGTMGAVTAGPSHDSLAGDSDPSLESDAGMGSNLPGGAIAPPDRANTGHDITSSPGHDRGGDANVSLPTVKANSTVDLLERTIENLESIEVNDPDGEEIRDDVIDSLVASSDEYRQAVFADSEAAFDHQRDAHQDLEELTSYVGGDDATVLENVSENIRLASNVSARLATVDGARAVAQYEDEFDTPGQRQRTESALGNAANAIERGDDASVTAAAVHYRTAWNQAESALDVLEDAVDPEVEVIQGPAVERNETVEVTVSVGVTDIRAYEYEEATVVREEDDPEQVNLTADPTAGGAAVGTTAVAFGSVNETQEVSVTAASIIDPDRSVEDTANLSIDDDEVIPEPPAPDEFNEVEVEDEASNVTVQAGGEGLAEGGVSIVDLTPEVDEGHRAGPIVRIENRTAIENATVSIPIDDATLDRDANLSVFTWDPDSDGPWTAVDSEVDTDEGLATATVESFSFFSVFDVDEWKAQITDVITLEDRHVVNGSVSDTVQEYNTTNDTDEWALLEKHTSENASLEGKPLATATESNDVALALSEPADEPAIESDHIDSIVSGDGVGYPTLSSNGTLLAYANGTNDGIVSVKHIETGEQVTELDLPQTKYPRDGVLSCY